MCHNGQMADKEKERQATQWLKRRVCQSYKRPPTRNYIRKFAVHSKQTHYTVGVRSGIPHEKAWREMSYEDRLAATRFIFIQMNKIMQGRGVSFRKFIYDYLRFDYDAYLPLYLAGGMTITNFVTEVCEYMDEVVRKAEEQSGLV